MSNKSKARIITIKAEYDGQKKFAIVQDHFIDRPMLDARGKVVREDKQVVYQKITKTLPVEYNTTERIMGLNVKTKKVAHFPHTQEGLKQAKKVLAKINKS